MGKVGKTHGRSARASRQNRDAFGKLTRGSGVEVAPEASAGREIPSATERAPQASAGWEIPSASERTLRAVARREMRSDSGVWSKKKLSNSFRHTMRYPDDDDGPRDVERKETTIELLTSSSEESSKVSGKEKATKEKLRGEEQSKLDARVERVTEWLMQFQESPKEKAPVENIFLKE